MKSKRSHYFFVCSQHRLLPEKCFVPVTQTIDPGGDILFLLVKVNNLVSGFVDQSFLFRVKPATGYTDHRAALFKYFADIIFPKLVPFRFGDHTPAGFGLAEIQVGFRHAGRGAGNRQQADTKNPEEHF